LHRNQIRVLYIDKNEEDGQSLVNFLAKVESARIETLWQASAEKALEYLSQPNEVDVIVTDDILSGMNGIEFIRTMKDLKYDTPIVFLTSSNDINLAVEVMHLGVKDYLLKEDIFSHIFPQSLLRIVEKNRLRQELLQLEIKQKRLEAMQEIVVGISDKISKPLEEMNKLLATVDESSVPEKAVKFLKLIKENIERMQKKLEKLRNLKEDKTVKYIRDIKMIDLS
jgi:two-component system, sensor histidine kinase and response regulator